jgi:hypothetical protein
MSSRKTRGNSIKSEAMKFAKLLEHAMRTGSAEGHGLRIKKTSECSRRRRSTRK